MVSTQNNTAAEMDQFMNDFLEGKYLEEKPKRHSDAPRRKSTEQSPKRGIRRTKTSDDAPSALFRKERSSVRRTKSGTAEMKSMRSARRSTKSTSNGEEQMDPQMVLRMMELYADLDDSEKAENYLHYGMKKKDSPRSSATGSTGAMPPDMILVRADIGSQAA